MWLSGMKIKALSNTSMWHIPNGTSENFNYSWAKYSQMYTLSSIRYFISYCPLGHKPSWLCFWFHLKCLIQLELVILAYIIFSLANVGLCLCSWHSSLDQSTTLSLPSNSQPFKIDSMILLLNRATPWSTLPIWKLNHGFTMIIDKLWLCD